MDKPTVAQAKLRRDAAIAAYHRATEDAELREMFQQMCRAQQAVNAAKVREGK